MSDSRTRIWFSLFVLAIFVLGLGAGLVVARRLFPPQRSGRPDPPGIERSAAGPPRARLVERLGRELQLTPEQRTQVDAIFEARRPRLEEVQREMIARAEQEQRELQAEIRKVLTPEQQPRFDRWLQNAPRGRGGRGRGF